MNNQDPKLTALLFNECINKKNIEGLISLMADDHKLVCHGETGAEGKEANRQAWTSFFKNYPDYLNHISRIESKADFVVMIGHSECNTEKSLNGKALWSAEVKNDKVAEWQVYEDTGENRNNLGLQ